MRVFGNCFPSIFFSVITCLALSTFSKIAVSSTRFDISNGDVKFESEVFSLHLGATRLIYDPASLGASLLVVNEQDYPMLVQSVVLSEDRKKSAPFVVTPPLFRLDSMQSSRLKIIRTGGEFPSDSEALQWVCVKGIPPSDGGRWTGVNNKKEMKTGMRVKLSINNCIKLIVRPSSLVGNPEDVAGKLEWKKSGNKIVGVNPTPFYMNMSSLSVGGVEIKSPGYIPPFSSRDFNTPNGKNGKIDMRWRVITDYGGASQEFHSLLAK